MAQRYNLPQIALLLDQEKAYDRIHPQYLQACLRRFGFPDSLIQSILGLFFQTQLHVNINGHLSAPCIQVRGLRQSDPLSPILFNLCLEPLLQIIQAFPRILSFQFQHIFPLNRPNTRQHQSAPVVKPMAYADDVLVFLTQPHELRTLFMILDLYGRASNTAEKSIFVSETQYDPKVVASNQVNFLIFACRKASRIQSFDCKLHGWCPHDNPYLF